MSQTGTNNQPETQTSHGDPDMAHIVTKEDQIYGYLTGNPVQALCGKVWVPSKDYSGLPVCEGCLEKRERIVAGIMGLN